MRILLLASGLSVTLLGTLNAQGLSERQVHDKLVEIIAQESGGRLPPGDTSVSWRPDSPILYHTVHRTVAAIRTGMARNDGMVGVAETRWMLGSLVSFAVRWTHGDTTQVDLTGKLTSKGIHVTGPKHDTTLALPSMRWAVADYAMEDHLLPVLAGLRSGDSVRIAVLRPYQLKWDTVTAVATPEGAVMRIFLNQGPPAPLQILLAPDSTILSVSRGTEYERHPLETTARFQQYQALVPADSR